MKITIISVILHLIFTGWFSNRKKFLKMYLITFVLEPFKQENKVVVNHLNDISHNYSAQNKKEISHLPSR